MSELRWVYLTAFLRALGTGTVGVLLGVYLAKVGLSATAIGLVVAAGLAGAAGSAVVATFLGDRVGRRRMLIGVTLLATAGLFGMLWAEQPWLVALCACLGMVNGMGRDRGAALVLEQAALPGLGTDVQRTPMIAGYTMLQDIGHAIGALLATLPAFLAEGLAWGGAGPHRATLAGVTGLGLLAVVAYTRLGARFEVGASEVREPLTPQSRSILLRLSALFTVDGLGSGFLTTALLSFFFFERFGASEVAIGGLFFVARLFNALSHLGAAWLARRIGLVNTMVFTHIPSSLFLATVAIAPNFPIAAALFLLREGLVEMDVPTRQSYILAMVAPNERTFASGVTSLVRLAAWAVAPAFAGLMMVTGNLAVPLFIGAGLKISYDLLLWRSFRGLRPPEESTG